MRRNPITVFENPEFGAVRTVDIDHEPFFVGSDVAGCLGYADTPKAVKMHVDDEDKLTRQIVVSGQNRNVILISESGLYSLILSSKIPTAKKFKHWVTAEVIPSIRKNGGYIANQENLTDDELLTRAVLVAQKKIAERDERIKALETESEIMKPKALFADCVAASDSTILIGELAKILKGKGVDIGQNRLFGWLRDNGYLIKRQGTDYNMPTQRAMEKGLFKIKETAINKPDGSVKISKTVKITGHGQIYFINKFCKKGIING